MIDEREILRLTSIVRTELDMSEEQSEEELFTSIYKEEISM